MSTFDYECKTCGFKFEEYYVCISKAKPTRLCPKCGKDAQKLISAGTTIVFKGPGWTPRFHK